MVYITRPSPKDISTICEKLIQRHPVLKDHVRGSYVSFIFKNKIYIMLYN